MGPQVDPWGTTTGPVGDPPPDPLGTHWRPIGKTWEDLPQFLEEVWKTSPPHLRVPPWACRHINTNTSSVEPAGLYFLSDLRRSRDTPGQNTKGNSSLYSHAPTLQGHSRPLQHGMARWGTIPVSGGPREPGIVLPGITTIPPKHSNTDTKQQTIVSVSYTHLTLPTIYSV